MKMKRGQALFCVAGMFVSVFGVFAAEKPNLLEELGMEQKIFQTEDNRKIPYCRKQAGDWTKPGKAAVVLFFHGAGERGTDNSTQFVNGAREMIDYCTKNQVKALLLFPQCPAGQQWVDTPWKLPEHKLPAESKAMRLAREMLDSELKTPGVDPKRVYAVGISMGGFGVWDLISRDPKKFAAAFVVCGGADLEQVEKFKHMPILIYHGDSDNVVLTKRSRDVAEALKKAGAKHFRYVEVPKRGHDSWVPAFAESDNWKWLFAQKKT